MVDMLRKMRYPPLKESGADAPNAGQNLRLRIIQRNAAICTLSAGHAKMK